jgi:hypothetical protein
MAGKSNYLEDAILNWLKGTTFPAAPATVYAGLHNGDPTDAGSGGTEVTNTIRGSGVGRVAVTWGSITTAAGANSIENSASVDFGAAVAGATMTHIALWTSATVGSGNMLYSAALTGQPHTVSAGTNVSFTNGNLDLTEE